VNTHPFDLKFVAFGPKFSGDFYVEFQEKLFRENFLEILCRPRPSSTKTCKIMPCLLQFLFLNPYLGEKIHKSTFISCLDPGKEARP